MGRRRFPNPKSSWNKLGESGDQVKREGLAFTSWITEERMLDQGAVVPQQVQIRFRRHWREQSEAVHPGKKGE
jgi:hypothetical protein